MRAAFFSLQSASPSHSFRSFFTTSSISIDLIELRTRWLVTIVLNLFDVTRNAIVAVSVIKFCGLQNEKTFQLKCIQSSFYITQMQLSKMSKNTKSHRVLSVLSNFGVLHANFNYPKWMFLLSKLFSSLKRSKLLSSNFSVSLYPFSEVKIAKNVFPQSCRAFRDNNWKSTSRNSLCKQLG